MLFIFVRVLLPGCFEAKEGEPGLIVATNPSPASEGAFRAASGAMPDTSCKLASWDLGFAQTLGDIAMVLSGFPQSRR